MNELGFCFVQTNRLSNRTAPPVGAVAHVRPDRRGRLAPAGLGRRGRTVARPAAQRRVLVGLDQTGSLPIFLACFLFLSFHQWRVFSSLAVPMERSTRTDRSCCFHGKNESISDIICYFFFQESISRFFLIVSTGFFQAEILGYDEKNLHNPGIIPGFAGIMPNLV